MQFAAVVKERDGRVHEKRGTLGECLEWIETVREKAGTIDVELRAVKEGAGVRDGRNGAADK